MLFATAAGARGADPSCGRRLRPGDWAGRCTLPVPALTSSAGTTMTKSSTTSNAPTTRREGFSRIRTRTTKNLGASPTSPSSAAPTCEPSRPGRCWDCSSASGAATVRIQGYSPRRRATTCWHGHCSRKTGGSTWPKWGRVCSSATDGFTRARLGTTLGWHGGCGVRPITPASPTRPRQGSQST